MESYKAPKIEFEKINKIDVLTDLNSPENTSDNAVVNAGDLD